jgi:hypothetical protein
MPPNPNNANTTNMSSDASENANNAISTERSSPTMAPSSATSSSNPPPSSSVKSSIHSSLRVVTNPGELGVTFPPPSPFLSSAGGKWTPGLLRSPSGLLLSPLGLLKSFKVDTPDASSATSCSSSSAIPSSTSSSAASSAAFFEAATKDLQFDPRFLAEAWSQESPQSVYALLGQPGTMGSAFTGFSPLAASSPSGGTRLLSPMGMGLLHQSSAGSSTHAHPQSFMSHLQSPLLAMSPLSNSLATSSSCSSSSSGTSSSSSTVSSAGTFYPPTVTIPASPHHLNPHLLSPMFATAISPSGGLGVSPDMLSLVDPSTVFVPPGSPSAILRHLLPPIMPRHATLNVKDLTLNELRPHFNKPMAVVAKELGVCITLMKKICRRNGLVRWPHRRIRSLVNRITSLQVIASTAVGAEKKRFQSQINALRDELSAVIQNPNEKSRKAQADAKARTPPLASLSISGAAPDTVSRKRRVQATAAATSHSPSPDDELDEPEDLDNLDDDALFADENALTQAKVSTAMKSRSPLKTVKKEEVEPTAKQATRGKSAASRPAAAATSMTGKRSSARFRAPPPAIKIPRQSEYEAARRELADDVGERPSSTTSTGSNSKRGSISSILC